VRRMRQRRGEIGEVLKTRAGKESVSLHWCHGLVSYRTLLKDACPVHLDDARIVLILLVERHGGTTAASLLLLCISRSRHVCAANGQRGEVGGV